MCINLQIVQIQRETFPRLLFSHWWTISVSDLYKDERINWNWTKKFSCLLTSICLFFHAMCSVQQNDSRLVWIHGTLLMKLRCFVMFWTKSQCIIIANKLKNFHFSSRFCDRTMKVNYDLWTRRFGSLNNLSTAIRKYLQRVFTIWCIWKVSFDDKRKAVCNAMTASYKSDIFCRWWWW